MAIIVGDIHGNVEKVKAFLGYKPEVLHIALGDYLDSFFETSRRQLETLQLLLNSNSVLLWGNHDLHYLLKPPFICTGFQHHNPQPYQQIIEANKKRFIAAYAVDGWLCTHAGAHKRLVSTTDISAIAAKFNHKMADFLKNPKGMNDSIFAIGKGRGGVSRHGGIFWHDFKRDYGLASNIKQIFGHTETKEPVITENYIALDTTNCPDTCYLFDTGINELVKIKMPTRSIRPDIDWGDEEVAAENTLTQEMIEERRAQQFKSDGDQQKLRFDDELYWGFADSEQLVIIKARTASEAWEIGAKYWYMGQAITPLGFLPLNAREISHKRNYTYDKKLIWSSTGPGSNQFISMKENGMRKTSDGTIATLTLRLQ